MRVLVTGVAGFVGSHTACALLGRGDSVVGVDSFSAFYDRSTKEDNIADLRDDPAFDFLEVDLPDTDLKGLLHEVDAVVHLSAQPGVRASWQAFDTYVQANIQVTQALVEAARSASLRRFVFASSSSVYGRTSGAPSSEEDRLSPFNPYGVTKLAAEQLCSLYAEHWEVPTISLRYFTVYGSRQRPDMLTHRVVSAALQGEPLPLYGSGDQTREFTHVSDIVAANLAALDAEVPPGTICNVGGGTSAKILEVIKGVEGMTDRTIALDRRGDAAGDVPATRADTRRAAEVLGWQPSMTFPDGLSEQIDWHMRRLPERVSTG